MKNVYKHYAKMRNFFQNQGIYSHKMINPGEFKPPNLFFQLFPSC